MDLSGGAPAPPKTVGVMVLLDRSGSMRAIQAPMTAAFAEFVAAQRADTSGRLWLSLHQFDSMGYARTYDCRPIEEVGVLGLMPRGDTPLRDALVEFCGHAKAVIDDPDNDAERLLLLIVTDGQENASRHHTWADVRQAIAAVEGPDCELIFLGTSAALLEAEDKLETFTAPGATVPYEPTEVGVNYMSGSAGSALSAFRVGNSARSATADYTSTHTPEQEWQKRTAKPDKP
jgi:hypothetical protein